MCRLVALGRLVSVNIVKRISSAHSISAAFLYYPYSASRPLVVVNKWARGRMHHTPPFRSRRSKMLNNSPFISKIF
jgi:hypothetical protein